MLPVRNVHGSAQPEIGNNAKVPSPVPENSLLHLPPYTHLHTTVLPPQNKSIKADHINTTTVYTFLSILKEIIYYSQPYGYTILTLSSSHSFILISRPCFLISLSLFCLFTNIVSSLFIF